MLDTENPIGYFDHMMNKRMTLSRVNLDLSALIEILAERSGYDVEEILSNSRKEHLTWVRHLGMWMAREYTDASYPAIAEAFGRTDHTTAMSAVKRINKIKRKPWVAEAIRELEEAWQR